MNMKRTGTGAVSAVLLLTALPFPPIAAQAASPVGLSAFADAVQEIVQQGEPAAYYDELTFDRESGTLLRDGQETGGSVGAVSVRGGRLMLQTGPDVRRSGSSVQSGSAYTAFEDAAERFGYHYAESDGTVTITNEFQTARLIVKAKGKVDSFGALSAAEGYRDLHIFRYADAAAAYAAYQRFAVDPRVEYVQPSHHVQLDPVADDGTSPALPAGAGHYMTWGAGLIGAEEFIGQYLNAELLPQVTVAVIDTGINTEPELFAGRILDGGVNYSNSGDDTVSDDMGHGTHCTGTICELTPPNVKILPVKVFDHKGGSSDEQIYLGLMYAIEQGAGILSMSFGGLGVSPLEVEALAVAEKAGVICCAAAGNNGDDAMYYYPGGISSAITVGAVNSDMELAGFSNRGKLVDVVAPGVGILSYSIGEPGKQERLNGTSMATPHVTACCALLRTYDPEMTPRRAETLLRLNAVDLGQEGFDEKFGWGLVCMKNFRWDDGICYAPEFSVKPGNYGTARTVEIETETPDAAIYYTTDGSVPSAENGRLYTAPLTVAETTWLRAVAVYPGFADSTVSETVYSIGGLDVPVPFAVENGVLTHYYGVRRELSVPESIDGQRITAVGAEAFRGCQFIEKVYLPACVTALGASAFASCENLRQLTAPGVTSLGEGVFSDCPLLESVSPADKVPEVGARAFQNCGKLRSVSLSGLTAVPESCFDGCPVLKTADLPDAVQFGTRAFAGCGKLRTLTACWNRVTDIGESAFTGCGALDAALYLPALQTLSEGAFTGDSALKAVCLPETVTALPANVFSGCSGLRLFTAPGVTKIAEGALALKKSSPNLTAVIPYAAVTEVGRNAFSGFPFGNGKDTVTFSALAQAGERAFAGAIAGVLDFPLLTETAYELFADAKIKAVRLERAETIGARSLRGCLSAVLTASCREIGEEAWQDGFYLCAAEPLPAAEAFENYCFCDEPLIMDYSETALSVPCSGFAPMQVCAAAPGMTYQWLRAENGTETEISGAVTDCCEADTSAAGTFAYICRMTAENGKQDSVRFTVTVTERTDALPVLEAGGMTAPAGDAQTVQLNGFPSGKVTLHADATAAVTGRLTDASGQTAALLMPCGDGSASCTADCGSGSYYLHTALLWDGLYTVSAAQSPTASLADCTAAASAAPGSEAPVVRVTAADGTELSAGRDYVYHTAFHNHICTVSLFGAGDYRGSAELTVPVYPDLVPDEPMPVSLRGADDQAIFRFVPRSSGTYYIYASRANGHAEEQNAFRRTGFYAGGSRYVTIRTLCKISDSPDGASDGTAMRYTDYSVPSGSYFSDQAELKAGQAYYLFCGAESAAEYTVVVSQKPATELRGAVVRGNLFHIYDGKPYVPNITVTLNGVTLTEGVDYIRTDSSNDLPGEAVLTLIGMGTYTGRIERRYDIYEYQAVTEPELTPLDEAAAVSCGSGEHRYIWFRAETAPNDKETVRYRVLNEKKSGGNLRYTLFRYNQRTSYFTRIQFGAQANDFDLTNGLYCLMVYPQYTELAGEANITVLIPYDLAAAELTVSDAPYTGGPIIPEITMTAPDGTLLQQDVDFRIRFPQENGNVMFGETEMLIQPTERSFGSRACSFQIFVDLPADAPEITVGEHEANLTLENRLAVYRLTAEQDTDFTLASADVANIVLRVFSPEAEMLEQCYGTGTKSLSFTVPAGESRLLMVKFNGTVRQGTVHFTLATDFRLLSDCEVTAPCVLWTGSRVLPEPEFRDGDYVLTEGVDYELRYSSDDINIGTATANYKGIGNYFGVCDVTYHIIAPELLETEGTEIYPVQIDTVYDGSEKSKDADYLVYRYTAGAASALRFDIYNCMCRMTVQLYDGDGHYRDSIFMKSIGGMDFEIAAGETCYLLFSATDISSWNQMFQCKLTDQNAASYQMYEDTAHGVTYRIDAKKKYAEVYALDPEATLLTLLPKVSGIPVKTVPEGLFVAIPDDCAVIGYAGCPAADYADRYHFAYSEAALSGEQPAAGDLNGDGRFSVSDAVLLTRILNEGQGISELSVRWDQADVNGDGMLDLFDLRMMLNRLAA